MTLLPHLGLEQVLKYNFYSPLNGVIFISLVTATICLGSVVHNVVAISEKNTSTF